MVDGRERACHKVHQPARQRFLKHSLLRQNAAKAAQGSRGGFFFPLARQLDVELPQVLMGSRLATHLQYAAFARQSCARFSLSSGGSDGGSPAAAAGARKECRHDHP
jgi:hypothetical protein